MPLPDSDTLARLASLVERDAPFRHVTHVNPDADGFGCALACSRFLRSRGRDSIVLVPSPPPQRLSFLAGPGEVRVVASEAERFGPDTVFLLYDVSTLGRLGHLEEAVRTSLAPTVVFDHHDGAIGFDALAFVDATAGATAEVLADVLDGLGAELTLELAEPLYVALISDTGSFNYGKTTPRSHYLAARLLDAGVRPLEVHGKLEGTRSLDAIKVAGTVLRQIELDHHDRRIAHVTLPHALWIDGGAEAMDVIDLVNQTIAIDGVQAGVLMIESEPGTTRLSFRSKGSTSIVETARALGGGGHRNAAGATLAGGPAAVRERVLEQLRADVATQLGPPL